MNHRLPCTLALLALSAACSNDDSASASSTDAGAGGDGASDASIVDGGNDGDASGTGDAHGTADAEAGVDPCAKSFFCDDFESYTAGGAPGGKWGKSENGGTIVVDAQRAHSGRNAVKASATAAAGYRSVMISLTDPSLLPVAGNHIFGRMMFYLDSSPTGNVHWTFLDGSGTTSQGYHSTYRYGGQTPLANGNQLMANYDTPDSYQSPPVGPSSDCWLHATTEVVPVAAWSCAEWEFDGPNNTMRFWLDTKPLTDLTMSGTGQGCVHQPATFPWLAPQFKRIDLGWESYQADGARTLWIDDVALGTERLGCPR